MDTKNHEFSEVPLQYFISLESHMESSVLLSLSASCFICDYRIISSKEVSGFLPVNAGLPVNAHLMFLC